jgi:hypothetical protein
MSATPPGESRARPAPAEVSDRTTPARHQCAGPRHAATHPRETTPVTGASSYDAGVRRASSSRTGAEAE